jgi:prevent-host-death family protein
MKAKTLSATAVRNRFGRVLREISQMDGPIIVERDGKPFAVIVSIAAYTRLQPKADPTEEQRALLESAFGLWAQRPDIDAEWLAGSRSRRESQI